MMDKVLLDNLAAQAKESPAIQVPTGVWHRLEALESGTVIVEMKDGAYEPMKEGDVR